MTREEGQALTRVLWPSVPIGVALFLSFLNDLYDSASAVTSRFTLKKVECNHALRAFSVKGWRLTSDFCRLLHSMQDK